MSDLSPAQVDALVRRLITEMLPDQARQAPRRELESFNLEVANQIGQIALAKAREMGIAIVYAAVDASGDLICLQRMSGSIYAALEVAQSKAFTSAALGVPTHEVADLVKEGGEFAGLTSTHQGRIIAFAGGLPVRVAGCLAGGVGISGGGGAQDRELVQYALNQVIGGSHG